MQQDSKYGQQKEEKTIELRIKHMNIKQRQQVRYEGGILTDAKCNIETGT